MKIGQLFLKIFLCTGFFLVFSARILVSAPEKEATYSITGKSAEKVQLLSVSRIWDQADHDAFTDLVFYQDAFLCTFREADEHVGSKNGTIRILKSDDGLNWTSVAHLSDAQFDLRDPKFSIMPDGRLMLTIGGSIYRNDQYLGTHPLVAFSEDGTHWSSIQDVNMPGEWIWRVTWHEGIGYAAAYCITDPSDLTKPWLLTLFQTTDGLHYAPVSVLDVSNYPSETTLQFMPNGTMLALVRRQGNGWIGVAHAPYQTLRWFDTGTRLGGPNFLILPDGEMWAASRLYVSGGPYTAVGPMTSTSYTPEVILPSGGDTGYPGMVYHDGILYISYYSSHEGKSNIYLARLQLLPGKP